MNDKPVEYRNVEDQAVELGDRRRASVEDVIVKRWINLLLDRAATPGGGVDQFILAVNA